MTTENAFWAAIGARPDDQLPRLVFADWLEERAVVVGCERCGGDGTLGRYSDRGLPPLCPACSGTGYVPDDGRADLAAALRATADRVPYWFGSDRVYGWWCVEAHHPASKDRVGVGVGRVLLASSANFCEEGWADYPTAEAAIRDLCRAWVAVNLAVGVAA